MDRVRLGRVLGRGARMAARTVYEAVDAATASPPPAQNQRRSQPAAQPRPAAQPLPAAQPRPAAPGPEPRYTVQQAVRTAGRLHSSARAAQQGVLAPVKRASRALSLELAGSFFVLFALSFSGAAWRFRGLAQTGGGQRLWVYVGLAALFGYFALSSFLRARRISRA
ncbi:hypothetical protein [Terriglobus sp.]|uniref:hypothetical protein n=1 Tax=Terriglobus sp. TaxID=1889013 RepID=UPI003AFF7412